MTSGRHKKKHPKPPFSDIFHTFFFLQIIGFWRPDGPFFGSFIGVSSDFQPYFSGKKTLVSCPKLGGGYYFFFRVKSDPKGGIILGDYCEVLFGGFPLLGECPPPHQEVVGGWVGFRKKMWVGSFRELCPPQGHLSN